MAEILEEYNRGASDKLKSFPAMLTDGDRAIYFHAGKHFRFRGSIIDGGCFVGGTTTALIEGLCQDPALRKRDEARRLIRVYDLFLIDDDYVLRHLMEHYPDRSFKGETSFLSVFEENLRGSADLLDVRAGDVTAIGYRDLEPIEIFGVDFCKALPVTDFVVREFFPRLIQDALVIQQDFVHEFHPHIHLSMMRLQDHLAKAVELKWGGSFAFRCIKPISRQTILERFGQDSSWYSEISTNVKLLRELIDSALYDENRWVLLLTLGIYYQSVGRLDEARAAYKEARAKYPQFEPSGLTQQMIGA